MPHLQAKGYRRQGYFSETCKVYSRPHLFSGRQPGCDAHLWSPVETLPGSRLSSSFPDRMLDSLMPSSIM